MSEAHAGRARAALYFANFAWWLAIAPLAWWPRTPPEPALLRLVKRCARWSLRCFNLPLEIEGVERASSLPQAIYIANHQSWLDQPAVICAAPHLLHFLGAAKYFSFPVLGRVLRTYRCIPVDRSKRSDMVAALERRVAASGSLLFYPEGTRSETDGFLPFRSGAFVLAARTQVPIVPLYVYGTRRALPRARPMHEVRRVPLRVVVGEPFLVPHTFTDDPDTTAYQERFVAQWHALRGEHTR